LLPRGLVDQQLCAGLEGTTLQNDHPAYAEARRVWNAMIDPPPALIARCLHAADVQRCLRFARDHGLAVTVRGGGHNIGGRAIAEGALLVDFSGRRQVIVHPIDVWPKSRRSIASRRRSSHRGTFTGVAERHHLGDGTGRSDARWRFGWLSRRFGLTCDHLVEAEVVTGGGDILVANQREHADLLWALRGGGGGGGIVTNFRFRVHPFESAVVAGLLVRESQHTEGAVQRFRDRTLEAPEEMTCMLKLCAAPPAPFLPRELHGKPVGIVAVCHSGDPANAAEDWPSYAVDPGWWRI